MPNGWVYRAVYAGEVCGRTTSTMAQDELVRLFGVDDVDAPVLPARWNVAPTQPVYAVAAGPTGARTLTAPRWGLVPSWAKGPRTGSRLINARAETLTTRPAFRSLVRARRALLPVSGFYEWRRPDPATGRPKQPFYFCRADGGPLAFAGLWDLWVGAEGHPLRTCTIITTVANSTMTPVHHRMPAVLPPEVWDEWLRPRPLSERRLEELLAPAPDDLLEAHPVGNAVNKASNDGPELVLPAAGARE
jgi:putative SOS response-associated peptidase YedK